MLILKQNAANTVPTPPAGKGTIFLNPSDDLAVKTADGNVTTFPTASGANTQVYFNDDGSFGANANFVYNKSTSVLTITGNVAATRVLTDNLLYANGTAWDLSDPGGANTQIQFNDDESFGGSAAFSFNKSSNLVSMGGALSVTGNANVGNIGATNGVFTNVSGNGSSLSSITGANVSGAVSFATTANAVAGANVSGQVSFAATANSVAGANVTGTVANATFATSAGSATTATTAGTVTTAAQPNITSVGTLSSLSVTGNVTGGNLNTIGNVNASIMVDGGTGIYLAAGPAGYINFFTTSGDKASISDTGNITGSNVIANSTVFAAAANVSGNVTAGNVYANSGTIGAQTLKGEGGNISNIQGGNVSGAVSSATSATTAGTVTTAAQPNITSVGTLSSLTATGNVSAGNLTTGGVLTVSGTGVSSIAGNLDMTSNNIVNLATPNDPTDAATKQYVDDVAQGLHTHDSCGAATPDTLATITSGTITYNNGASGVGANLVTTGSFNLIDGVNVQTAGTRILVKNEANSTHNGIYTWSNATVITRATDFDTPTEMAGGDFTFVTAGTLYDNTGWVMTDPVTTVGTSPVPWVQFSGAGTYTAGTGLTLNGSQFNISNTAVTAASYGSGDSVASFTVNAQGQLTAASNVVIAANAANLTGTTLASGITTSSLTTVGTLGTLNVTGNANVGNIGAAAGVFTTVAGSLTTAAQPNITSVGTLTSASVTGNVTAGNVYANSGTIGATNLTGTLTTAAQPNITSVGTLTSLGVNGTITGVNITANTGVFTGNANGLSSIQGANVVGTVSSATTAGTVTTAAQPNITSVGTLTSVSITGNVTAGNVYANSGTIGATNLTGTLTTAAQPNITSVGTLTSLTSSGNISGANIVSTGYQVLSVNGAVSAAGYSQGTATTIASQINVVSTVVAGSGVILPNVPAGIRVTIMNTSANALLVYPAASEAINSLALNAAYSQPAGTRLDFISTSATQWYTLNATYG